MIAYIDPHVIGITESWANKDIVDAELGDKGGEQGGMCYNG